MHLNPEMLAARFLIYGLNVPLKVHLLPKPLCSFIKDTKCIIFLERLIRMGQYRMPGFESSDLWQVAWGPLCSGVLRSLPVELFWRLNKFSDGNAAVVPGHFKGWVAGHWLGFPLCPENQSKAVFEELRDITFPAISCISAVCVRVVWRWPI